jgi:hypothetical protein
MPHAVVTFSSAGVVGLSLPPPPPGAIVFNTPASNTKTVGGGAIAGIVVGAVVGCALLAGLALYVIKVSSVACSLLV